MDPAQSAQFLLASRSPRRRALLAELGYVFSCAAADIDETPGEGESGADFARRMALGKARALAGQQPGMPVLAADTDVELFAPDGGREALPAILGKPRDRDHCLQILGRLSEAAHTVHCAVALVVDGAADCVQTATRVVFGTVPPWEASAYWDSGEPQDKAGAYAIQGFAARWVRRVEGSYSGVIGLPVVETRELLARHGIHPLGAASPAPLRQAEVDQPAVGQP